MKKFMFTLISIIFMAICVCAQEVENVPEGIGLEKVVESSLGKSILFSNAQQWASVNDPTCDKRIEIRDDENKTVVVNMELKNDYSFTGSQTSCITYKFRLSVKIDCKDKKYRYTISNPSVLLGFDKNININSVSTPMLKKYSKELELVERISKKHFQKILDWEILKVSELLLDGSERIYSLSQQGMNEDLPRKDKRNIEEEIEKINKENVLYQEIINRWIASYRSIEKKINDMMKIDNDF